MASGVSSTKGASLLALVSFAAGAWTGRGPVSKPQSINAWARTVKSSSFAAFIAAAISLGPPSSSRTHCIPSRSPGAIPNLGAAASHSSSFRQARVTENPAMLPAIAAPGFPSIPAVITARGSISLNADRTQMDVSTLRGPESPTNSARKTLARVSSSKHPISLACPSLPAVPGAPRARIRFAASSASCRQARSDSESWDRAASGSCSTRGEIIFEGACDGVGGCVGVGAGVGVALGVAVCSRVAVGSGVAATVGCGSGVSDGATVASSPPHARSNGSANKAARKSNFGIILHLPLWFSFTPPKM